MDMMIGVRRFLKSHKHSEFLEAESTLDTLEDSVQVREEFCLIILQSKLFYKELHVSFFQIAMVSSCPEMLISSTHYIPSLLLLLHQLYFTFTS